MIYGNSLIVLGHGDVLVTHKQNYLTFINSIEPHPIGIALPAAFEKHNIHPVTFTLDVSDCKEFITNLDQVIYGELKEFGMADCLLSFEGGIAESAGVVKEHVLEVLDFLMLYSAC